MIKLTKDILAQYCDLKEEVKDLRRRIANKQSELDRMDEEGTVTDSVKGGYGGIQHFKISGFPYPEYSRKKTALYLYKAQLEYAELDLLELTNDVEDYIQSIKDSRMRSILRYRYIDDLSWTAVGNRMGGGNNPDGVRKAHDRFLEKN